MFQYKTRRGKSETWFKKKAAHNLTCLLEEGLPWVQALAKEKRPKFLCKMKRQLIINDPLGSARRLTGYENHVMNSHLVQGMKVANEQRKEASI